MSKDVALALSSGGPRGFAYIGAIEELTQRGYNISSVSGTSIGSLIGGIYAAGKLNEVKDWLFGLDAWKVFSLMDLYLGKNHFVKGEKVIGALKEIVSDVNIEDMRIPFCAIATDLYTGEEVIFDKGPLFTAIRSSISIPSLFRPVRHGNSILIDGGIANCLPSNRVHRNGQDILVAFDVNAVDTEGIRKALEDEDKSRQDKITRGKMLNEETRAVIDTIRNDENLSVGEKFRLGAAQGQKLLSHLLKNDLEPEEDSRNEEIIEDIGDNYYTILSRTFSLMNHVNSRMSIERDRPDVLVSMPFDSFGVISDYAKAREISELGRILMKEALDRYESGLE